MLFWKCWIDAAQFCFEAQSVIAMRLMKIATGGQDGAAEWTRMVLEKIDAGEAAHTAGALALVEGKGMEAATKLAMAPIKRRFAPIIYAYYAAETRSPRYGTDNGRPEAQRLTAQIPGLTGDRISALETLGAPIASRWDVDTGNPSPPGGRAGDRPRPRQTEGGGRCGAITLDLSPARHGTGSRSRARTSRRCFGRGRGLCREPVVAGAHGFRPPTRSSASSAPVSRHGAVSSYFPDGGAL
jgi:hypothetical protein